MHGRSANQILEKKERRDDEDFAYLTVSLGSEEQARFERLQRDHA